MEEECTKGNCLYDSDQLASADCERVSRILKRIESEDRVAIIPDLELNGVSFPDDARFEKK